MDKIRNLIYQFKKPYLYINIDGKLNKIKLSSDLQKFDNILQANDILTFINQNDKEILNHLKSSTEVFIRHKIDEIDFDEFIRSYKDTDKKREEFLYNSIKYINTIIDDIFGQSLNHKKLSKFPDLYYELAGKLNVYRENLTCNRQKIETQLEKILPKDLTLLYPQARQIKRHFKIIYGPTNSGKTYEAFKELKQSINGIYLGPLRLLAYEKYTELMDEGITASLVTGEEEIINENSKIQCSTVEMCDLNKDYDCIVLDEAQLCTDPDRGCYWTRVILGSICQNIIICCAPEILPLIKKLIDKCGDTYEIIEKQRLVPLEFSGYKYDKPQDGDAYIVFSRKNVHQVANELRLTTNKNISILYGNLPYTVRQNEAEKFNNGESQILVATDCISMGLNLPIKRVILMETEKFDGTKVRVLTSQELKQIIGRAGRYKKYSTGYFTGKNAYDLDKILKSNKDNYTLPYIDMPKSLLKIDAPIKNIISVWNRYNLDNDFRKSNNSMILQLCNYAEKYITDRKILWKIINFKFDYKEDITTKCYEEWKKMVQCLATKQEYIYKSNKSDKLLDMEEEYKIYDLIYQYYGLMEDKENRDKIVEKRNKLANRIMIELDSIKNNKKWFS